MCIIIETVFTLKNNKNYIQDICNVWYKELRFMVADEGLLLFLVLLPLAYPVIYSWIYNNEVAHDVPVVVVDNSHSSLSREFARRVDASSEVNVAFYAHDMEEAKDLIGRQRAYGILYFPDDFAEKINRMEQTTVGVYCDMSIMLAYKNIYLSTILVSGEMGKNIQAKLLGNYTSREDEVAVQPLQYDEIPIFNTTGGYGNFILPAVLILILQQTLLLAMGLTNGSLRDKKRGFLTVSKSRDRYSEGDSISNISPNGEITSLSNSISSISHKDDKSAETESASTTAGGLFSFLCGRSLLYIMLYALTSTYVLLLVPKMFSFVSILHPADFFILLACYLPACLFFAMASMAVIRQREDVMIVVVFTSILLLFISGVSWPAASMPPFWEYLGYLFPSTFGIKAFVALNSMGARIPDVLPYLSGLIIQAALYLVLTILIYRRKLQTSKPVGEIASQPFISR